MVSITLNVQVQFDSDSDELEDIMVQIENINDWMQHLGNINPQILMSGIDESDIVSVHPLNEEE